MLLAALVCARVGLSVPVPMPSPRVAPSVLAGRGG